MVAPRQRCKSLLTWTENAITSNIDDAILTMKVSYSMDLCAQIDISVHDPMFEMAWRNYFWVTRDIWYRAATRHEYNRFADSSPGEQNLIKQLFEVATISVKQGPASSAVWDLSLRTKAIQQLKRDRGAQSTAGSAGNYVRRVANEFGLIPVVQHTTEGDPGEVNQFEAGKQRGDSKWDVIKRLAGSAGGTGEDQDNPQYVAFETNGYLFFCSMRWLLGKWGTHSGRGQHRDPVTNTVVEKDFTYIPVAWPPKPNDLVQLMQIPTVRKSDNDPLEVTGSMNVAREVGMSMRPGMTIKLSGIPTMEGYYLINSVEFDPLAGTPVAVGFRSPERLSKNIREFSVR